MAHRNLTLRYGTVLQYEQAPLTLYEALDNQELGAVVTNRFSGLFGASIDFERVSFSVLVPTAANWGTEQAAFGADGFYLGDSGASVKVIALRTPRDVFNLGARAGIILPTGRQAAYVGEGRLRFNLGGLATLGAGPIRVASDFSIATRSVVRTSEDFVAANEVQWGNAVRLKLPDASRLGLNAQLLTRAGLSQFLRGGAENALEAIGGLEVYPSRKVVVGVGAGRGLTEGYGTTDFRVLTHLTIIQPPAEPLPPRYVTEVPPPPIEPPPIDVIVEEPVVFEEDEVVKQVGEEIFIPRHGGVRRRYEHHPGILEGDAHRRRRLHQQQARDREPHRGGAREPGGRLRAQLPARREPRAADLGVLHGARRRQGSDRVPRDGRGRAQARRERQTPSWVWTRPRCRRDRRVRFLITRQFAGPDEFPVYPDQQILPWNGKVVPVIKPVVEEVAPPEPEGPELDEFGLPIIDDELDLGTPGETGDTGTEGEKDGKKGDEGADTGDKE